MNERKNDIVMRPFAKEEKQKITGISTLLLGVLFLTIESLWRINLLGITINTAIGSMITAFFGLLYLMDAV